MKNINKNGLTRNLEINKKISQFTDLLEELQLNGFIGKYYVDNKQIHHMDDIIDNPRIEIKKVHPLAVRRIENNWNELGFEKATAYVGYNGTNMSLTGIDKDKYYKINFR